MPLYPPPASGSGSVATDAIWDAAGDIALGTGADAAARLARGTPGQLLLPDGSSLAWTTQLSGDGLAPTGALAQSWSRLVSMSATAGTSGTLRMTSIWLPKGLTVTNILVRSGATGESGGSNAWAALYDTSKALLRQSTNSTGATAIGANVEFTFALTSAFVTTYAGHYYIGMNVVATTMPNIFSLNGPAAPIIGLAPILGGNTNDTGLTTTAPANAGTITASGSLPFYCWIT